MADGDGRYICMLAGHGISKPERFYPFCKSTLSFPFGSLFGLFIHYLEVARSEDVEPVIENVSLIESNESRFEGNCDFNRKRCVK